MGNYHKRKRLFYTFCFSIGMYSSFFILSCSKEPLILKVNEYRNWTKTTQETLTYPIPGHEDKARRIFISPEGTSVTFESREGRRFHIYPPETQIIKEILNPQSEEEEEPLMLTGMVKRPHDPRARGGWLWIVYTFHSPKETIVSEEFCITCHGNANEPHPYGDKNPNNEFRDYVFFPYRVPEKNTISPIPETSYSGTAY